MDRNRYTERSQIRSLLGIIMGEIIHLYTDTENPKPVCPNPTPTRAAGDGLYGLTCHLEEVTCMACIETANSDG